MSQILRSLRVWAGVLWVAATATAALSATTGGGGPGTSCSCYVDGFPTECPIIDTTGYPQADCGYLGDTIGGGGGGTPTPDDFPPDLTPLGSFFFFGRPTGSGSCVPETSFEPGDDYCAQIVMINQGGLNTSGGAFDGIVIDQGGSKVVPGVQVRVFLQPVGSGLSQVELALETLDFPLVPRTGLEAPTPVLLNVAGEISTLAAPGSYRLAATVDVTDVLPEPPGNNSKQADPQEAITITGGSPELESVAGSGSVVGTGASVSPTLGQPYRVTSEVRNEGAVAANGGFQVVYEATLPGSDKLAPGVPLGQASFTLSGFDPGEVRTVTLNNLTGLAGVQPKLTYELRATLNSGSAVLEQRRLVGTFQAAAGAGPCATLTLDAKADGVGSRVKHVSLPFTFTAEVSPPQCASLPLVFSWSFGDGGSAAGQTVTHTYGSPGSRTATVSVSCAACPSTVSAFAQAVAFDFAITKPIGDPALAPNADNEITFNGAAGVATVAVEATITPASATAEAGNLLRWSMVRRHGAFVVRDTGPGTTSNLWTTADATGKLGLGLTNTLTMTGYPANNSDFGPWEIRLAVEQEGAGVHEETPVELFFDRDQVATGRTDPNWFVYWLQAIGGRANTDYGGAGVGLFADTPGMINWSYGAAPDKTKIVVYDVARLNDAGDPCVVGGAVPTTGIDTFEDTVLHENHHTVQIANADAVVGTVPGTPWRFGWSWNQGLNHNHWTRGADGQPGAAGANDDGVGIADDFVVNGPGELGFPDDVDLTDIGDPLLLWPQAFGPLPALCWPVGLAIEEPAYEAEPDNEDARANVDWADPGKQHETLSALD